jgi:type II restriction enzyme
MNLHLNTALANQYRSKSQAARVITEEWVSCNAFCPICGNPEIRQFENNRPVADFYCDNCHSEFELKSKANVKGELPPKIPDGAYDTMVSRITSFNNPHLLVLTHNQSDVKNFLIIPKHFFTPTIIEKRKPLANTARRAGWIGCNIIIGDIPSAGKIPIIKNGTENTAQEVMNEYAKTKTLETRNVEKRGWLLDVLSCVERITSESFSLEQIYNFEYELKAKHPENNFVRDKIRQQLQFLRDRGFIEFTSRGVYKKA